MDQGIFSLRLLGGARLESDGGRLDGEPAQRHRMALLALLALSPDGRMPREKLMALLWPEHGPRQARRLLNTSVYVLRRALGKEAILSEGDDLRLASAKVRCDVGEFRAALEAESVRTAVELYRGPLMDGHYLPGAHDFEMWQEARRAELEASYYEAVDELASEAESARDLHEAIRWRRASVRAQPTDTHAVLALMELLEGSGDPAGALAVAEDHASAMASMFEAEPSPDVTALAERIREAPSAVRAHVDERTDARRSSPPTADPLEPDPDSFHAVHPAHTAPSGPRLAWLAAAAATVALVVALSAYGTTGPAATSGHGPTSIAVLPFTDMSPRGDQGFFSDGLSEELLNILAKTPGLDVAARSSSFQFRSDGVDIPTVGRRLGVGSVVEGSVRLDGDQLRVTAQLIDANSGYHLWSDQYDRPMRDVFAVQQEIAEAIAAALNEELSIVAGDTTTVTAERAEAYPHYLRGRHEWRARTEEGMWSALEAFQQAIALDPTFAAAHAGLADVYQLLPDYAGMDATEGLARARTAALRAIALDSTLAEAHASLAAVLDDYDRDRRGSEAAYRRAIDLNPGYTTARHWLAIHLADEGRFDEAVVQIELARRLDPLSSIVSTAVGAILYFARDFDASIAEYRAVLELEPDFALGWALLGRTQLADGRLEEALGSLERSLELSDDDPSYRAVYATALAAAGRGPEAREIADALLAGHPHGYVPYSELASAYLRLGEEDQALELFEHAWDRRDPALKHIAVEPLYDAIRPRPAFQDLMRRAGFETT